VEAMWLILQQDKPDDYVIATGETHSVREFVEKAFAVIDIKIEWSGVDLDEVGKDAKTGKVLVSIDPRYFRPTEVDLLLGNPTKAKTVLKWNPSATPFDQLVKEMVLKDIELVQKGDMYN